MSAPSNRQAPALGFWCSAVVVCCAATFVCCLTVACQIDAAGPGARVRDAGFLRALREVFAFGVNPFSVLPDGVSAYRPLLDASDWLRFAAASAEYNLAFNLVLLLLAAPVAAALRSRLGDRRLLTLLGLFFLLPVLYWPLSFEWYEFLNGRIDRERLQLFGKTGMLAITAATLGAAYWIARRVVARVPALGRRVLRALAAAGGAAALVGAFWAGPERPSGLAAAPDSPNVLLISIDTLRADHLSCYGYERPTSPAIDRIASEGVLFERLTAVSSWTLPTHMSLMTAVDPLVHGVLKDDRILALGVPTLSQRFLEAGYSTAGVVGGPYLNALYGFSRGFELYDDYSVGDSLYGASHDVETSAATLERAAQWLERWATAEPKRPFFLFVHFWDVHHDYQPPPPYDTLFQPASIAPEDGPERRARQIALYDGEIRYVDDHVGRLLEQVEAAGRRDDTIVAITADHGEELWQRGQRGHRSNLFDEVIHIPLIVRFPGRLPAGRRVTELVRQIDIAPTLLDLAGLDPASVGGEDSSLPYAARSFAELAKGEPEGPTPGLAAFADLHDGLVRAVGTQDRKYIVDREKPMFFRLDQDPGELENRLDDEPAAARGYAQLLDSWVAARKSSAGATEAETPPEQLELLKSLGYIQ